MFYPCASPAPLPSLVPLAPTRPNCPNRPNCLTRLTLPHNWQVKDKLKDAHQREIDNSTQNPFEKAVDLMALE